jgi:hypothetical protein
MPPPWTQHFGTFHAWIAEDELCTVTVDAAADPAQRGDHTRVVSVMHALRSPDGLGQVAAGERADLDDLDAAILERLQAAGDPWFVGRRVERGDRYLFFYLEETAADVVLDGAWPAGYAPRWFTAADPEWEGFRESLAPTPLQHQLLLSGEQLAERVTLGDDLEAERPVDHVVVLPTEQAADEAAAALRAAGFAVTPESDGVTLSATRTHAVDILSVEAAMVDVFGVIVPLGGEYDGWGAPMAGDEARAAGAGRPRIGDGRPTADDGPPATPDDAPVTGGSAGGRRRRFWRR